MRTAKTPSQPQEGAIRVKSINVTRTALVYDPLKCIYSAYNGVWNPVSQDAAQNPKRQVKKYTGPYRWLVPLLILRLISVTW